MMCHKIPTQLELARFIDIDGQCDLSRMKESHFVISAESLLTTLKEGSTTHKEFFPMEWYTADTPLRRFGNLNH